MIPIIDTHQHLWDLDRFRLPWLDGVPALNRDFLLPDYLAASAGLNIAQTVYMEVDVAPDQKAAEAEYALELCARGDNPLAGAVIGGLLGAKDFADYVARFAGN